jgi:hypothetical protein
VEALVAGPPVSVKSDNGHHVRTPASQMGMGPVWQHDQENAFAERALLILLYVALLSLLALNSAGPHVWVELVPFLILLATLPALMANLSRKPLVKGQPLSVLSLDNSFRALPIPIPIA